MHAFYFSIVQCLILRCNDKLHILQVFEEDTGKGEGIPPEVAHEIYEFVKLLASHPADEKADSQKDSVAYKASKSSPSVVVTVLQQSMPPRIKSSSPERVEATAVLLYTCAGNPTA